MYLPKCWESQHKRVFIGHWANTSHPYGFGVPWQMTSSRSLAFAFKAGWKGFASPQGTWDITQNTELNITRTLFPYKNALHWSPQDEIGVLKCFMSMNSLSLSFFFFKWLYPSLLFEIRFSLWGCVVPVAPERKSATRATNFFCHQNSCFLPVSYCDL